MRVGFGHLHVPRGVEALRGWLESNQR